jgi:hypothetical protein
MKGNTLYSSEKRDYATLSMYQEWRTTAFWAKVIAVITYVLLSLATLGYLLILIVLYFGGGELAPLFEGIIGSSIAIYVVSLFQVAVYFVINTFLFRFSKSLRMAVEERDQEVFENAWLSFRNYFRGIGALIIIFFLLSVIFVASVYSAL